MKEKCRKAAANLNYQREFDLTLAILKRMRLSVRLLHEGDSLHDLDEGFRVALGLHEEYETALRVGIQLMQEKAIYTIVDRFMCNYICFHLPEAEIATAVVIGPYLTEDLTRERLLEQAERLGLGMQHFRRQTEFYASLPVFIDPSAIMTVVTCLGEVIWGPESFQLIDMNSEQFAGLSGTLKDGMPIEQEDILRQMKQLEERYAYENELMEIVSKGLVHRAEVMMSSVSQLNYQSRASDPLRNMKNYCIICNTLLRKAAQQGGVHPLHLDRMSTQYAHQIENTPSLKQTNSLIGEMIRGYCRLVHTHASKHYASAVQKTLTYIEANLSGDLSLRSLASLMQVSPGYLSTLFHRETGMTLAEHITAQRMKAALQLLKNTHLQIQTVAQLSGFPDPNYFGKQFKRFYGITPLKFRREQFKPSQQGSD